MLDLSPLPFLPLGLSCFIVGLILTFITEEKEIKVRKGKGRGRRKAADSFASTLSHAPLSVMPHSLSIRTGGCAVAGRHRHHSSGGGGNRRRS